MMRMDTGRLKEDYKIARDLMERQKYVQAVVHLEKLLKQSHDESNKELFKTLYKDIIFAYRTINNKTRAEYYLTKAMAIFGDLEEVEKKIEIAMEIDEETEMEEKIEIKEEFIQKVEEIIKIQETQEINNDNGELGEDKVLTTVNDFEMLKKPFKIKANDSNEINFNNIFVEIFTAVESKKYFGYFKLNLNKLNDCLSKGINALERKDFIRLKWEVKTLVNLIEKNTVTSFDSLYKLEFEELFKEEEENKLEDYGLTTFDFAEEGTFVFGSSENNDYISLDEKSYHEEIKKGIDRIVDKNKEIFEAHNTILDDIEYKEAESDKNEEMLLTEQVLDLNIENSNTRPNQNETIIVEINSEKVRENNLEVSKVKDVVLEVLENLRKADLDVFAELKEQSEERAQKVGVEKEKKGLLSGLEGMLEIKFGVVSLDLVPEMKKISELEKLYEVKEKILATRDFTDVEKIVEASKM